MTRTTSRLAVRGHDRAHRRHERIIVILRARRTGRKDWTHRAVYRHAGQVENRRNSHGDRQDPPSRPDPEHVTFVPVLLPAKHAAFHILPSSWLTPRSAFVRSAKAAQRDAGDLSGPYLDR